MAHKPKDEDAQEPVSFEGYHLLYEGPCVLSRITTRPELQVRRDGIDEKTVLEYCKAIEGPMDHLPAMALFTTAGEFNEKCALLMADGHHSLVAYKRMNRQTGPVKVYRGDEHDALRYALETNGKHGKSLTQRDREYDVRLVLADDVMKDWSVRKIAALVNCSKSTVQNIKNPPAPKPKPKTEPEKPTAPEPAKPVVADKERHVPGETAPIALSAGPMLAPPVVHERQPSTLPGKNERLETLRSWVQSGEITRDDISNIFADAEWRPIFVKRSPPAGTRTLIVRERQSGIVLIEADVHLQSELPAVIEVSVDDPRTVEYSFEEDPFAVSA